MLKSRLFYAMLLISLGCYFYNRFNKDFKKARSRRRIWSDFHVKRGMKRSKANFKSLKYIRKKNFDKYRFNTIKNKIR